MTLTREVPVTDSPPESITVNGHSYVHVAACPCRLHAQEREIGYTAYECERDMQRLYGSHCANPEEHAS